MDSSVPQQSAGHKDYDLILHAPNIHMGGGLVLLKALLDELGMADGKRRVFLILDARIAGELALPDGAEYFACRPTLLDRFKAELMLKKFSAHARVALCFSGLPPLFSLKCRSTVFLQNRILLGLGSAGQFKGRAGLRIALERLWLKLRVANADEYVVQTPSMARAFAEQEGASRAVSIFPFAAMACAIPRAPRSRRAPGAKYDFVYVASGDAHKNHVNLVEAWRVLAEEKIFPVLCLTLDERRYAGLWKWVEKMRDRYGLKIENKGVMSHGDIQALYAQSGALIFPSTSESLGLPLIEARRAGLSVLAAELDYVRDVLDPDETFDPASEVSIARAVKRFLGVAETHFEMADAKQFLQHVLNEAGTARSGSIKRP